MGKVTKPQAEVMKVIADMIMKAVYGVVALVLISVILYNILITDCNWENKLVLGLLESFLIGTTYKAFGHYFPKGEKVTD